MSWRDYERLIRERNADPAAWLSAQEGNPNTPADALRLAIRKADPEDMEVTRVVLQRAKERLYAHAVSQADYGNWEPTAQYQAISKALEVLERATADHLAVLDDVAEDLGFEWIQDEWEEM